MLFPRSVGAAKDYQVKCYYQRKEHKHKYNQLSCEKVKTMTANRMPFPYWDDAYLSEEKDILRAALTQETRKIFDSDPKKYFYLLRQQMMRGRLEHLRAEGALGSIVHDGRERREEISKLCSRAFDQLCGYLQARPRIPLGLLLVGCGSHVIVHVTDPDYERKLKAKLRGCNIVEFYKPDGDQRAPKFQPDAEEDEEDAEKQSDEESKVLCDECKQVRAPRDEMQRREIPIDDEIYDDDDDPPVTYSWWCPDCVEKESFVKRFDRDTRIGRGDSISDSGSEAEAESD